MKEYHNYQRKSNGPDILFLLHGRVLPIRGLGCMVHDEVQADVDAAIMAGSSQCCKIIHGSKFFLNLPEISNCITAVTASLGSQGVASDADN